MASTATATRSNEAGSDPNNTWCGAVNPWAPLPGSTVSVGDLRAWNRLKSDKPARRTAPGGPKGNGQLVRPCSAAQAG